MKFVKIQATLGPACSSTDRLSKMIDAGMDGCRLNMSHCSPGQVRELVAEARRLSSERNRPIAIGADLRGPKLRISDVDGGGILLEEGATFELTSEDRPSVPGLISVNYPYLADDVHPGDPVLLNDGVFRLRVESVKQGRVTCIVEKGGVLTSRKGFNIPGVSLRVPSLTDKDLEDISLAVAMKVDFLYVSFARSRKHIQDVRSAVARLGANLPLVAKIERQEGADALAEIVDAADGICVARGDLGIETPIGSVPEIQREAVRLCRRAGKFVMMGGQVLASMVSNPTPLRAEVADIATVVRDGYDAIVLSDETAAGEYPVEAVRVAAQVVARTESYLAAEKAREEVLSVPRSRDMGPVVVVSPEGTTAQRLSTSRSASPVVAAVDRSELANWLSTWWGVIPVLVEDLSDPASAAQKAFSIVASLEPSLAGAKPLLLCEL